MRVGVDNFGFRASDSGFRVSSLEVFRKKGLEFRGYG